MSADLMATLTWLAAGGSALAAAALVSFLAEKSTGFQRWPPEAKLALQLGASVLLAVVAFAVVTFVPAEVMAALAPWWRIVFGAIVAVLGNQYFHAGTKALTPRKPAPFVQNIHMS